MGFRLLPTPSSVGLELDAPPGVTVERAGGDIAVRCHEARGDGRPVGSLEIAVFQAALVIDRDGILEETAGDHAARLGGGAARVHPAVAISLPAASGYRAEVELGARPGAPRPTLPYIWVLAIAPHDLAVRGGVVVIVRSAAPVWPAADAILASLRILTRGGRAANDLDEAPARLPLVGRRS